MVGEALEVRQVLLLLSLADHLESQSLQVAVEAQGEVLALQVVQVVQVAVAQQEEEFQEVEVQAQEAHIINVDVGLMVHLQ